MADEADERHDHLTEGHEHNHANEQEAIACAMQNITKVIAHDLQHRYPEGTTDQRMALAIAACLLTLSAKYASLAGHHPIEWLAQQVEINLAAAEAQANAENASNN